MNGIVQACPQVIVEMPIFVTMKKRTFLKLTGAAGAGLLVAPFAGCETSPESNPMDSPAANPQAPPKKPKLKLHVQAPLGYALDALAPAIDSETMGLHYGKHHAGYVSKLNMAIRQNTAFEGLQLEDLLSQITDADDHMALRNNGGGHFNHSLYWRLMEPGGAAAPTGPFKALLDSTFGSTEGFLVALKSAGGKQFGSGWAWLIEKADGQLAVTSTPNQDNPLMTQVVDEPGRPIIGVDVWEHAYYLNYQNRRGDYLQAFTTLLNWDVAAAIWSREIEV